MSNRKIRITAKFNETWIIFKITWVVATSPQIFDFASRQPVHFLSMSVPFFDRIVMPDKRISYVN